MVGPLFEDLAFRDPASWAHGPYALGNKIVTELFNDAPSPAEPGPRTLTDYWATQLSRLPSLTLTPDARDQVVVLCRLAAMHCFLSDSID